MNNIRKFAALALMAGVCAAPLAFMSDSAQAQNYPKAGQYYPKAGNYPRAAGKSAPQAAPAQSSSVQNSAESSAVVTNSSSNAPKAGARNEDKMYYDRYENTMKAWRAVEAEIKGGQRDISTYDGEVLKRNHRNIAVLWCMIHKEYSQSVKRIDQGRSTLSKQAVTDIRDWMGSLYYLVNAFEDELKSRGLEFDSYESIKREQGVRD